MPQIPSSPLLLRTSRHRSGDLCYIPVRAEPLDRPLEGALDRLRTPAELSRRLLRRHEHLLARHLHGIERRPRLAAAQVGPTRTRETRQIRDGIRNTYPRRLSAADSGQPLQNLFERQIVASQNVALAGSA